jgi:hypothetical protein
VEVEEDAGASISPKVVVAELAGVVRNGQATVAAIQIARGLDERERGANGAGLGQFDRPRPEPGWLSRAEWAGWASRPVGPAGQMGQIGFGQLI